MNAILLESILVDKLDNQQVVKLKQRASISNLEIEEYVLRLIEKDINFLYFDEGLRFDIEKSILYDKNSRKINLTKYEKSVLTYLIKNKKEVISLENLIENVWKGKPNTSIFAVRNVIRKIRVKSCYSIITNNHNLGYQINPIN